jgi:hypothetical protein
LTARLAGGSGTLAMTVDPGNARCQSSWSEEVNDAGGPRPTGIVPEELWLYADEIDVRIGYFVHIHTQE